MRAAALPADDPRLPLAQVLICGAAVVTLSMGIRHGFGLWLQPLIQARGWKRETFAFALAMQNLVWGAAGPVAGMLADRWGAMRILILASVLYALGLVGMATATSTWGFAMTTGVLIGLAQSGCTFAVVYGVIGRNVAAERRSWAMGVAAAAGSFGQFLMVPLDSLLIAQLGWQPSLLTLAAGVLLIIPLARGLHEPTPSPTAAQAPRQGAWSALREAMLDRNFNLLMAGYFVCGFQVVFIGVHLPAYLKDHDFGPEVATTALALIGLFNVIGTYAAGVLGQRLAKRHVLAGIYLLRSVVITVFVLSPLSATSVYVFAAVMGVLWLSTVPPTNAIVAQVYGVQHLSMLGGMVFFSHQIGSFLGVWLGGRLYDASGSYNVVWWMAVALGLLAAAVNLPIRETPRLRVATS